TPAAVLVAASSGPVSAVVGEGITVTLTVTNTGGQDAVNVSASPYGNSAGLIRVSGPSPSSPVTIPAGGSQTFSWTYSVSGAGPISLTLTATGQTCSGSSIVQASAPISLTGLRPAALVASNLT